MNYRINLRRNPTVRHISSLNFKIVNLGNEEKPQLINLGINCSLEEEKYFVKLCREFKDVFSWTYEDLKNFDTEIIQHNIPMKHSAKPYQQKLRKMHPSLKPSVKKELEKLLIDRIIF